jgi:DNA-directed RNA polymerase specialized sigma24 family protein
LPRTDAFDDYYRESRERLLLQVYAFAADPETARGALDDAYVAAAEHWGDLAAEADRDVWMRKRAFEAALRWRESKKQPWYRGSRNVADEHQRLLTALAGLRPIDRHLVVARYLAGLSLAAAASELEVPARAASDSLDASTTQLAGAGIETSPAEALVHALADLGSDLHSYSAEDPARLKAHALRRRRTRRALTGAVVIALAVGIGGITAAQEPDTAPNSVASTKAGLPASTAASQPTTSPPPPTPPSAPILNARVLTSASSIRSLDRGGRWTVLPASKTSTRTPADSCLDRPSGRAVSYQARQFTADRKPGAAASTSTATLTQSLAGLPTPREARTAYRSLVTRLTRCSPGPTRITGMALLRGAGDQAVSVTTRHVDRRGIYERRVLAARTGPVVVAWMGRSRAGSPAISAQVLYRLLGSSINAVCARSGGTCSARPYQQRPQTPPAEPDARGFLSPVDLPVFDGLTRRWTATQVESTGADRASTQCDQGVDSRATSTSSRTYVIAGGGGSLPAIFGLTETVGRFPTAKATTTFVQNVVSAVESCSGAPDTVTADGVNSVDLDRGTAYRWDVSVQTSPSTTVVYRSGLVRMGQSVAQVTFTPGGDYDPKAGGHVALLRRAAERLAQLPR